MFERSLTSGSEWAGGRRQQSWFYFKRWFTRGLEEICRFTPFSRTLSRGVSAIRLSVCCLLHAFFYRHDIIQAQSLLPNWHSFSLHPRILRWLYTKGFSTPTPIQVQAIPIALNGKDVVGVAETVSALLSLFSFTYPFNEGIGKDSGLRSPHFAFPTLSTPVRLHQHKTKGSEGTYTNSHSWTCTASVSTS